MKGDEVKHDFDEAFMKGATITIFVVGVLLFLFFWLVVPAEGDVQQDRCELNYRCEPYACELCREGMDYMGVDIEDVVELLNPQTLEPVLADGTPLAEPYAVEPAFTG